MNCTCPYLPCTLRGNCTACIAKSRKEGTLCNCMEPIAEQLGAALLSHYPCTVLCEDSQGVAKATASEICKVLQAKPHALFCLPAGDTAKETFALLADMAKKGEADFSAARFIQLDEWLDLDDSTENCAAFLQRNFLTPAGIVPSQITKFNPVAQDYEAECKRIDAWISENGPIDLMLLGLGMNGHLGLNEPGVDWDQHTHVTELSGTTKSVGQKYFSNGAQLTRGITLGMRYVYESKRVILQVSGAKKADIVSEIYTKAPCMELPGSVMQLIDHGVVILDKGAAAHLNAELLAKAAK